MTISSQHSSLGMPAVALPSSAMSDRAHPQVVDITRRLFGGEVSIGLEHDPEFPSQYFVVSTTAQGSIEHLVEKVDDWHRIIREALGDGIGDYRLIVDPQ